MFPTPSGSAPYLHNQIYYLREKCWFQSDITNANTDTKTTPNMNKWDRFDYFCPYPLFHVHEECIDFGRPGNSWDWEDETLLGREVLGKSRGDLHLSVSI